MFHSQPEFVCDLCERTFAMKHNLQKHITNCHFDDGACVCSICEKKFASPLGLKRHLRRGHNRFMRPQPECDHCGQTFERKENIVRHMKQRHALGSTPSIPCETCNEKCTSGIILKRHIDKFHKENVEFQACDECNLVFRKESLIAHVLNDHKVSETEIVSCQFCSKVYSCHKNLKRHIVSHHGTNEEFKCIFCPKKLTSNLGLRRHIKTSHHIDMPREFSCDYCSKSFSQQPYLDTHISLHHKGQRKNPLKFPCECGKVFETEPELRQHVKTEHSLDVFYSYCKNSFLRTANITGDNAKKQTAGHDCEVCQKHFGALYDLRIHIKVNHNMEFSLEYCNVCFSKFYSKETLDKHRETCVPPDTEKNCGLCDKLFTEELSLKFHMKVFHTPEQVMLLNGSAEFLESTDDDDAQNESRCEHCDKVFTSEGNLKKHHKYVHLGMQRCKCPECGTHFNDRRNMRRHIRIKHPHCTRFPLCRFCRKRFESAKACHMHLQRAHSFDTGGFPCDKCSLSFANSASLNSHIKSKHVNEEELLKCGDCGLFFEYETLEPHKSKCGKTFDTQLTTPKCVICMKEFSAELTLKRHIRRFHQEFDPKELIPLGYSNKPFFVECKDCIRKFSDNEVYKIYLDNKRYRDFVVFKCETCGESYSVPEYAIVRYKRAMGARKKKRPPHVIREVERSNALTRLPGEGLRAFLKRKLKR